MKLLICTQKMDRGDDVLGFMHGWVTAFAKHTDAVTVICLYKGEVQLPENVKVISLGKEEGVSRATYLWRFYRALWQERRNYDSVFVHMNQIYVLLGGLLWHLMGKRIGLWYAHGHTPKSMRIAEKLVDVIITSTESGFRLPSAKKRIVGQGIDMAMFASCDRRDSPRLRLVSVGRISPIKDYETMIRAGAMLHDRGVDFSMTFIGKIDFADQQEYLDSLKALTRTLGIEEFVHFPGAVPNAAIATHLCDADMFISASKTGSLDKAGLEAMASGALVVTCNEAFEGIFREYTTRCMYAPGAADELTTKIAALSSADDRGRVAQDLQGRVATEHGLDGLVTKIVALLQ